MSAISVIFCCFYFWSEKEKKEKKENVLRFQSVENRGIMTVIDRDKYWRGYLENFLPKIVRVLFVYKSWAMNPRKILLSKYRWMFSENIFFFFFFRTVYLVFFYVLNIFPGQISRFEKKKEIITQIADIILKETEIYNNDLFYVTISNNSRTK